MRICPASGRYTPAIRLKQVVLPAPFGPIVGAFLLTGLAEGLREVMLQLGVDVPGVKQVFYGACLLLVVIFLPDGVWPPLARALGIARKPVRGDGR